jgi:hypothetical protein
MKIRQQGVWWFRRKTIKDLVGFLSDHQDLTAKKAKDGVAFYKSVIPCADCDNLFHYAVMSFDHKDRGTKQGSISQMYTSKRSLIKEIAKCDLVCLNCHRLREYRRDVAPATRLYIERKLKKDGVSLRSKHSG